MILETTVDEVTVLPVTVTMAEAAVTKHGALTKRRVNADWTRRRTLDRTC